MCPTRPSARGAAPGGSFGTLEEAQRLAEKRLPRSVYSALLAGSERGITGADNVAAFAELGFAPRIAAAIGPRLLGTSVMGQRCSLPVVISPTGVQAVHPDGELAVARAAAARGIPMGLSMFASRPMEEVIAVHAGVFFQLHWVADRDVMLAYVERARAAGAAGIILTLDWSFSNGRDRSSPRLPEALDLRTMLSFAPEVVTRPRWLARYLAARQLPRLTVPNLALDAGAAPGFFAAYTAWSEAALPTWADVAWLTEVWHGPLMLKGICRVVDAKRAVAAGVSAISVSNHGGNNLDGTPASIRCLAAVADAVGEQVEVLVDGGVGWGSDVVKALALGARAVMIGRGALWGLAAGGQAGVENVLDILGHGINATMLALGRASVPELGADALVVPTAFHRILGADQPVSAS